LEAIAALSAGLDNCRHPLHSCMMSRDTDTIEVDKTTADTLKRGRPSAA
jgi:hypothetical protein